MSPDCPDIIQTAFFFFLDWVEQHINTGTKGDGCLFSQLFHLTCSAACDEQ